VFVGPKMAAGRVPAHPCTLQLLPLSLAGRVVSSRIALQQPSTLNTPLPSHTCPLSSHPS
jgi:hypothetical protein